MSCPAIAAIPARNEAAEIEGCLRALAEQRPAPPDAVVLCLNNCGDDTAGIVRRGAFPFAIHMLEVELPDELACAGAARRLAMDHAAWLAGRQGILLTTDADARVPPDWLFANRAVIEAGAEGVAGRGVIEPEGAKCIPPHLHAIDARECAYAALLDELRWLLDPDPFDPWPRHDEHSGASIAVTVDAYRRAGGMPPVPLAEDRAFFAALRRVDARIRHSEAAPVTVSARLVGRAPGGMADTMRRRMNQPDEFLDDRLEPVSNALRRVRLRRRVREIWQAGVARLPPGLSRRTGLSNAELTGLFSSRFFGAIWSEIEDHSAVLRRKPVALADLSRQTERVRRVRDALRMAEALRERRSGTALSAAAA